jgi:hypothetical protein
MDAITREMDVGGDVRSLHERAPGADAPRSRTDGVPLLHRKLDQFFVRFRTLVRKGAELA